MPLKAALASALLLAAGQGSAAARQASPSPAATPETHWSGRGQLGLQINLGVTETLGATAQHTLERRRQQLELELETAASYSESSSEATRLGPGGELERVTRRTRSEDLRVKMQGRRHLSGDRHTVGLLAWHRNPNQGLEHQARVSLGHGWKLVHRPGERGATLSAEASVGYLAELHTNGDRVSFPAGALALDLERALGDGGRLEANLEVIERLPDGGELLALVTGSLHVPLGKHLGLSVSLSLSYDDHPADRVFDPEGDGRLLTEPETLYGNVQMGLGIQW